MSSHRRCGATLLELLVGLVVAGIILAGLARALVTVEDAAIAGRDAAMRADGLANGRRMLRELVSQMEPTSDSASQFNGNEARANFRTRCRVPGGWSEPCLVSLDVGAHEERSALIATLSTGRVLPVLSGVQTVELRYLDASGGEGRQWVRAWGAGILAPYAMGILVDGDTIIVRIGERG